MLKNTKMMHCEKSMGVAHERRKTCNHFSGYGIQYSFQIKAINRLRIQEALARWLSLNLSSMPGTHLKEAENWFMQAVLGFSHVHTHAQRYTRKVKIQKAMLVK